MSNDQTQPRVSQTPVPDSPGEPVASPAGPLSLTPVKAATPVPGTLAGAVTTASLTTPEARTSPDVHYVPLQRRRAIGMVRVTVNKVLGVLVMTLVIASFTFFLIRLMPGDPIGAAYEQLVQSGVDPAVAHGQVQSMYGFISDAPIGVQYLQFMANLLRLNLGVSISYAGLPVSHLVASAAPYTILPVLLGMLASFLIGVTLGVIAAVRRDSGLGGGITIVGSLLHGIPQFVLALLLLFVFSTLLGIAPYGAPYDAGIQPGLNGEFLGSLASHAALPIATYALASFGGWLLTTKSSVVSVLGDDFIMAAELRGLRPGLISRYIARNAMLPLFTILALTIAGMFGGSLYIEQTFNYSGLGNLLLKAIRARDYPLMSGSFLLISFAVIVANAITDVLYALIDPRVRTRA